LRQTPALKSTKKKEDNHPKESLTELVRVGTETILRKNRECREGWRAEHEEKERHEMEKGEYKPGGGRGKGKWER